MVAILLSKNKGKLLGKKEDLATVLIGMYLTTIQMLPI